MVDFGPEPGTNKFVCPNDRQLALRAKLRTGWSVKTATLGCKPTATPLKDEEQSAIIDVIRRAEQLDLMEQERIGRLMERLENMRRNALGKGPAQCLLCGDRFGILGAQKALCVDCGKYVCLKCAIDSRYSMKSKSSLKDQWLCMICAETREVWKKSGAWFFKGLPKYTSPNPNTFPGRKKSKKCLRKPQDDVSSSDDERQTWTKLCRRGSNTESTHDAVEALQDQSHSLKNYSRQTSTIDVQQSKELDLDRHVSNLTLCESKSWEEAPCEDRPDWISAYESQTSRDSLASRSTSELNWSDSKSEEKRSLSICSLNSSIFKNSEERKNLDASMGTIELALTYDPVNLTLHCAVYRAKNLIPMDINGLSDPFCKLNILPDAKTYTRLRTKTVHKTRNPEFNENLTFYEMNEDDLVKKSLHVLMLDDDKYGHDYMGEARISLSKLKIQNTIYLRVPLEKMRLEQKGPIPTTDLNQWFDDLWLRGQILLSLCYSTKKRSLLVGVIRCTNLLPMDNNGYSDPFVKLHLRPGASSHKKYKTTIKWKNLNPVFNEEFAFESRPTDLSTQNLCITVWDKDYGKSNDYLGGLVLGGVGSKGYRLKHWLDMIRYPDHRHEYWHNLTEDPVTD